MRALQVLGAIYVSQEKYAEAEKTLLSSLQAYESVLGVRHLHTTPTQFWLGVLYWRKRMYENAVEKLTEALEVLEPPLGADHPDTALTRLRLEQVVAEKLMESTPKMGRQGPQKE